MTTRDHQKSGKGFKSKGWKPDTAWDIRKGKILFKSGGVIQSLSEMNPQNREKDHKLSLGRTGNQEHQKPGSSYKRRSWTFKD